MPQAFSFAFAANSSAGEHAESQAQELGDGDGAELPAGTNNAQAACVAEPQQAAASPNQVLCHQSCLESAQYWSMLVWHRLALCLLHLCDCQHTIMLSACNMSSKQNSLWLLFLLQKEEGGPCSGLALPCLQGSGEADERLRRVMGEGTQSTERRAFVGGMPFSYEVIHPPAQRKPWHRARFGGAVACHSLSFEST